VRGGDEQDELKAAQSFEIPGRDLNEDAALFFGLRLIAEMRWRGEQAAELETGGPMTIGDWRKKIDEIDTVLVQLLNLRAEFAVEVAQLKEDEGLSICAPEREQKILSRMENLNPGPLDREAVTRIYRVILDESRRIQGIEAGKVGEVRKVGRRRLG
jgi:chorismate mutase